MLYAFVHLKFTPAQRKTPDCLCNHFYYISKKTPEHMSFKPKIYTKDHHESNQYSVCVFAVEANRGMKIQCPVMHGSLNTETQNADYGM